jgi:hypothetical protein
MPRKDDFTPVLYTADVLNRRMIQMHLDAIRHADALIEIIKTNLFSCSAEELHEDTKHLQDFRTTNLASIKKLQETHHVRIR